MYILLKNELLKNKRPAFVHLYIPSAGEVTAEELCVHYSTQMFAEKMKEKRGSKLLCIPQML